MVVLNFNGRHLLPECLASLARLTTPAEVVVADNGSTDDSLAYPHHDIMSYENDGLRASRHHCVSNLNVKVVEKAFSSILNPPGTTAVAPNPAAYVHMKPSSYSQPACPLSSPSYTDVGYLLGADPL